MENDITIPFGIQVPGPSELAPYLGRGIDLPTFGGKMPVRSRVIRKYKNQWSWAGFTKKKIKSCRAMARLIAIVANWWNVYCRLADPTAHREAITSRPSFLRIMGRSVESGRRRTVGS